MQREPRLSGQVAVVTGAARGIGLAIARSLLGEGCAVAMWDRDETRLRAAADSLAELGGSVLAVPVDISSAGEVVAAVTDTKSDLGPVSCLVNNAAVVAVADVLEVTDEQWEHVMRANAFGPFNCIRALVPDMKAAGYGKIVNIGSLAAQQGRPSASPAYAASKGAVLGLTVSLARTLGEFGICVNAVNPGFIRTEIHDVFSAEQIAELAADVPLKVSGRPGGGLPEDVASAVLYLCSKESDYISGAFLNVNGATRTG